MREQVGRIIHLDLVDGRTCCSGAPLTEPVEELLDRHGAMYRRRVPVLVYLRKLDDTLTPTEHVDHPK